MSVEVKQEFKEFVGVLSKGICEDILKDDVKKINSDYSKNNAEYKKISQANKQSIIGMNTQVKNWENEIKKMKCFIDKLEITNKVLLRALNKIDEDQANKLREVIGENNKLLNKYHSDIHKLNTEERENFIRELSIRVNAIINLNIEEVRKSVSSEKFQVMNDNTALVLKKFDEREKKIEEQDIETKRQIKTLEENVTKLGEKVQGMANRHTNLMSEMRLEIDKKNNIIIGLIVVCILLSLFK